MSETDTAPRPRLRALNPAPLHYERVVPKTGLVIGRDPEQSDHLLSAARVSRKHCWIGYRDGLWVVHDLDSTNGVFIDGQRITGEQAIQPGQVIGLGRTDPADFEFVVDDHQRRILNLMPARRWLIGRAIHADIALPADPTVSEQHAEIRRNGDQFEIVDLGSLNGIHVNGRRVGHRRPHKLSEETVVEIGNTRLELLLLERGGLEVVVESRSPGLRIEAIGVGLADSGIFNLSRVIDPGQLVGIIPGATGRRSDSVLELLAGRRTPETGVVLFDGRPLADHDSAARHRVGFVQQEETVDAELTVWQHLRYTAELRLPPDLGPGRRESLLATTLTQLGLAPFRNARLVKLPPLQRRLVAIAGELVTRPALLCLDHPFDELDADQSRQLIQHLRSLTRTGTIVLINGIAPETIQDFDQLVEVNKTTHSPDSVSEPEQATNKEGGPHFRRSTDQAPAMSWRRTGTLFRRQCRIRLTDSGMILLYLLLPALLSLAALALLTGPQDIRLVLSLVTMAAAVLTAAPEIGADRIRLRHEVYAGVAPTEDLLARLGFCWAIALVQVPVIAGLFAFDAGIPIADWPAIIGALIAVAWAGSALGLMIGAIDTTRARLVLPLATAIIALQLIVTITDPPEQELTGWLFRRVRDLLPAYWGMELLTLMQDSLVDNLRQTLRAAAFLIGQVLTWLIIARTLVRRQVRSR